MKLADRFQIPVISFIDTPGAYPGLGAEQRGQASAIANSIECCMSLTVPNISIIIGEGGSGGAIALAGAGMSGLLNTAKLSGVFSDTTKGIGNAFKGLFNVLSDFSSSIAKVASKAAAKAANIVAKSLDDVAKMGAKVIEVHFTDSRKGKVFRDHKVSLTKDEIVDFIKHIKLVKTLQGSSNKKPTKSEIKKGSYF